MRMHCLVWLMHIQLLNWCFLRSDASLSFLREPLSKAALVGNSLRLDCVALETIINRPVSYKWFFNDVILPGAIPSSTTLANNSLYIPNFQDGSYGGYHCAASVTVNSKEETINSKKALIIKPYLNDFSVHPTPINTISSAIAVFTCTTGKCAPAPLVTWERDGTAFLLGKVETVIFGVVGESGSQQMTSGLQITASASLTGEYRCKASNPLNGLVKYSSTASLKVNVINEVPYIVVAPPSAITSAAGLLLAINCSIRGYPEPNIQWMKNGFDWSPDGTRIVYSSATAQLVFNKLMEDDAGIYVCNGSNSEGSIASPGSNVTVAVIHQKFNVEPSNVSVIAGQSAKLLCSAPYSVPMARIVWYKYNNPLTLRTGEFSIEILSSGDLYFSNVQLADEGVYSCVAVNKMAAPTSRSSSLAWLTVTGGPKIIEPPVPVSVIKESLLFLTCLVEGDPTPAVSWTKDGYILVQSNRIEYRQNGQKLIISQIDKLDEGQYVCLANNKYGTRESQAAKVTVIVPVAILQSVNSLTANEGKPAIFKCVAYADPTPQFVWLKDHIPLVLTDNVHQTNDGLKIEKTTESDAGLYTCRVSNTAGTKESSGTLTVYVKPRFVDVKIGQIVNKTDNVYLMCRNHGIPIPAVDWYYNGSTFLPSDVILSADRSRLFIKNVQINHTGTYRCVVRNSVGFIDESGFLKVQVPPVITAFGLDGKHLVLNQGQNLELYCVATSVPDPVFKWYHNDVVISATLNRRIAFPLKNYLLVQYSTSADAGVYKCAASNVLGYEEATQQVYINVAPIAPKLQIPVPMSPNTVMLTWEPSVQPTYNTVKGYVIAYSLRSGGNANIINIPVNLNSTKIGDLQPATRYLFWMAAKNEVGTGLYTGKLVAKTYGSAPTEPQNLKVLRVTKSSVDLAWEEPEFRNGDITDYEIYYRQKGYSEFKVLIINIPKLPYQEFTVVNLKSYMTYEFKVRASTIERGLQIFGPFTKLVVGMTDLDDTENVPSASPQNMNATVLSNTTIEVSWEPIPLPYQHGPLIFYSVHVQQTNLPSTQTTTKVKSTILRVVVLNLLPWRYYTVVVTGVNAQGSSPPSRAQIVHLLPGVPTGAPQSIRIQSNILSMSVTWQEVAERDRNSVIQGYVLRYGSVHGNWSHEVQLNLTNFLAYNISNLKPWTRYWVQVKAFTKQLDDGFGPYSRRYMARTLQQVPGPVRNVKSNPSSYSAWVSWDPPDRPNGEVKHYLVSYKSVRKVHVTTELPSNTTAEVSNMDYNTEFSQLDSNNSLTLSSKGRARDRRALNSAPTASPMITVVGTNITIESLTPTTIYTVSISGVTGAGPTNEPVTITIATLSPTSSTARPTNLPSTSQYSNFSSFSTILSSQTVAASTMIISPAVDDDGRLLSVLGIPEKHLPYFIGGCTAAALIILAVIIFVIVICFCRKQQPSKKPAKFFISRPTSKLRSGLASKEEDFSCVEYSQSLDDTVTDVNSTIDASIISSGVGPVDKSVSLTLSPTDGSNLMTMPTLTPTDKTYRKFSKRLPKAGLQFTTPTDSSHRHTTAAGIENPGYSWRISETTKDPTFSASSDAAATVASSSPDMKSSYSKERVFTKKHNLRMRSKNAAVIARDRERKTSSTYNDDRDILVDNEAIVVFEERTVL